MKSFVQEFQGDHEKESDIVITIDGESGAGKGTIADYIASKLNIYHFSASDVFHNIAEDRGISHVELAKRADKEVDLEVDRRTLERGLQNNCVIDSRIASWVLGEYSDLKIYVKADVEERAKRIAAREDIEYEKALEETKKRDEENSRRYNEYYGIDTEEIELYDVLIDNTEMSISQQEKQIDKILEEKFSEKLDS